MPPTGCAGAPPAPDPLATDNEWAAYKKARDDAGDDCRAKLGAVDAVVKSWPRGEAIDGAAN